MKKNEFLNEYFEWLVDLIRYEEHFDSVSYRKLLMQLHDTEFIYSIDMDSNRFDDGVCLRYRYQNDIGCSDFTLRAYLDGPCSVLEMMIALALRCDETIMDNPDTGERTAIWFWSMVNSLGLISSTDDNYRKRYVMNVIDDFLNREYKPNGKGGLFTVEGHECDLSEIEIWHQMCWYLDSLTEEE